MRNEVARIDQAGVGSDSRSVRGLEQAILQPRSATQGQDRADAQGKQCRSRRLGHGASIQLHAVHVDGDRAAVVVPAVSIPHGQVQPGRASGHRELLNDICARKAVANEEHLLQLGRQVEEVETKSLEVKALGAALESGWDASRNTPTSDSIGARMSEIPCTAP